MRDVQNPVSSAAFPAGAQGILVTCDTYFENNAVRQALMLVEEVSLGPRCSGVSCRTSLTRQLHVQRPPWLPTGFAVQCVCATLNTLGSMLWPSCNCTQHYDKLRGTEGSSSAAGGSAGTSGTKDISALLAEEVAELKDRSKQRFKKHDTGVKGCFLVTFPADEGTTVHLGERGGGVIWMGIAGGTKQAWRGGRAEGKGSGFGGSRRCEVCGMVLQGCITEAASCNSCTQRWRCWVVHVQRAPPGALRATLPCCAGWHARERCGHAHGICFASLSSSPQGHPHRQWRCRS